MIGHRVCVCVCVCKKGRPKTVTVLGRPFGAPFGPLLDPFGAALADDESCLIVKSLVNFSKKQIPKSKRILYYYLGQEGFHDWAQSFYS